MKLFACRYCPEFLQGLIKELFIVWNPVLFIYITQSTNLIINFKENKMEQSVQNAPISMPRIGDKAPSFKAVTTQGDINFPEDYLNILI